MKGVVKLKSRNYFWKSIPILVMALMLTACTGDIKPSDNTKKEAVKVDAVSSTSSNQNTPDVEIRPAVKDFELLTSKGNQSLMATLQYGKGFSLYVFEYFTFNEETGRLSMSSNPNYYVDIESLPSEYDLAHLEIAGEEELSQIGEVFNYSGELVEHPLGFADLYLQTTGQDGIRDYILWKSESGDAFLFRLHNPKGMEASDFAGPILVSLSTVQSEKNLSNTFSDNVVSIGMSLQDESNESITLNIYNKGSSTVSYGKPYTIEEFRDGQWIEIPFINDFAFTSSSVLLLPDEVHASIIFFEYLDADIKPGQLYRVVKPFTIEDRESEITLAEEFTVSEE